MEVSCKYKVSGSMDICCQLRYPFTQDLTADEKKEIISSISSSVRNVPSRYEEMYNAIASLNCPFDSYLSKAMVFTTKADGSCYIDIILKFSSMNKFENFIQENNLTATLF